MKTLVPTATATATASWGTLKWAIALTSGALVCGLTAGAVSTAQDFGAADGTPRITVLADGNTWGSPAQYGNTWG